MLNIAKAGGTTSREVDSTHVVSLWYIPGGWDYSNALAVAAYFKDGVAALAFADSWSAPPEMASIHDLSDPRVSDIFKFKPQGECDE